MSEAPRVSTADQVLAVLREAAEVVLEVDPTTVRRESRLVEDLGADSLAVVEIVEIVEERLADRLGVRVHVDDDALDRVATLGDVVDHVAGLLPGSSS
ncbi:MAG TPA: acyl carrier protein [Mycobacteriales bacterium]|nr:acyl carrier protein [Mycobacteriales bacterium]